MKWKDSTVLVVSVDNTFEVHAWMSKWVFTQQTNLHVECPGLVTILKTMCINLFDDNSVHAWKIIMVLSTVREHVHVHLLYYQQLSIQYILWKKSEPKVYM